MTLAASTIPSDLSATVQRNRSSGVRIVLCLSVASIVGAFIWFCVIISPGMVAGGLMNRQLPIFTVLLVVHAALHWGSQYIGKTLGAMIVYLTVQAIVLCAASLVVHYPAFMILLVTPLLAEVVCIFERPWHQLWTIVYLYSSYIIGTILTNDMSALHWSVSAIWATFGYTFLSIFLVWLSGYLPLVGVFALEQRSRRQAHDLLVELEAAHRKLADYAEQVEQLTLAAERARMARELHDTLAQGLAGIVLQMEALEEHVERADTAKVMQIINQIKGRARASLADSRRAISDLRVVSDEPDSLLIAIQEEAKRFSSTAQVPCALELPPSLSLPASSSQHTLRFVSEGLANVARHAHASRATVTVRVEGKTAVVEVRDDGVGFEPDAALKRPGHYGLIGLHERARLAGGVLEVNSATGQGTTLRLRLALANGDPSR